MSTTDRPGLSAAAGREAAADPNVRWQVGWFRVLYVACIVGLSIQTLTDTTGLTDHHTWLASVEILGALLLLGRRLQRVGLVVLLLVYAIAAAITMHRGHLPLYLVLYAGTAVFLARGDG